MLKKPAIIKNGTVNTISAEGAIKMSESLMRNSTLTTLYLGGVIEEGELT